TYHHDTVCLRVIHKQLNSLFCSSTNNRVTTNTDSCSNTHALFYNLVSRFISKRTRFRNNTYVTFLENEPRHDTYLSLFRSDNTRAVRAYKAAVFTLNIVISFDHVSYRDTFGDRDDHFDTCLGSFHNSVGSKGRRNENNSCVGT